MAHNNSGNIKDHEGKLDDAIAEYRTAIAINPKLANANDKNLPSSSHGQSRQK